MSIICKTGCGQQVVYENIEFTDGFAYQCPHNLDNSLHYCPIFYSDSSLFTQPGGAHPFDSIPDRENSYGNEIEKMGQIFYEFDELIISKNKNLSIEDIEIYKTRLQSFLNIFPIIGLFTDTVSGMRQIDKHSFEKATESGALSQCHVDSEYNHQYVYFTLSSSPLTALQKIYYILEGNSTNFKKCQQLEKEISNNDPTKRTNNFVTNPYELQLLNAQKQLSIFEKKFEKDPQNKKIKDEIKFYHELINGIDVNESDTRKHTFNGVSSTGIKDEIQNWYQENKKFLEYIQLAKEEGIPINKFLEECNNWDFNNWNYMPKKMKLGILDDMKIPSEDKFHILDLTFDELDRTFPKITDELIECMIYGSEDSHKRLKQKESQWAGELESGLFDINKIRELIFQNTHNDVEEMMEEILSTDDGETSSDISSEFEKHEPIKYDFNSHFNHNSIVHLSNTEKHIRKLIINQIYDYDINFLKKHFKQIWIDMENTKLRDGKNIRIPKEETELDYATFGQLLEILKNKETKNRVKIKKLESHENLIQRIEIILPYRNQLDHGRGTINGDLDINTKCIVVGVCNEIDEFCSAILYQ
jgi:hypothetical protein